jgi:hypothetical protein
MVAALAAHRERAVPTDAVARSAPALAMPCSMQAGTDLR